MKTIFLDRNTIGFDIDVSIFKDFGEFEEHNSCSREESKEYIKDADIVIFNKTVMDKDMLENATNVKLLCVTATGYDNIDIGYCLSRKDTNFSDIWSFVAISTKEYPNTL